MTHGILVVQHSRNEGPAALAAFLDAQNIGWTLCRLDRGEPLPDPLTGWRAVALLGGTMSAYDDSVPFLAAELRFIERLLRADCPVLGICLGAQLLARVLGARVAAMPAREIGWHPVRMSPQAASLLSWEMAAIEVPRVFQWHGDAFELPAGSERLFMGDACPEQGFRVGTRTIAVQFHPEVDEPTLRQWLRAEAAWLARQGGRPQVQTGSEILGEAVARLAAVRPLSEALYRAWLDLPPCGH